MRPSSTGLIAAGIELAVGDPNRLAMLNDNGESRDQANAVNLLCQLRPARAQLRYRQLRFRGEGLPGALQPVL
jgi:hypothetical protein